MSAHIDSVTRPDASRAGTFEIADGLEVNRMGFGAMRLCGEGIVGPPADESHARAVAQRAVDYGVDFLDAVAAAHDATRYQIALAWLLETSPVTLPIPGTLDLNHLEQNVAAAEIDLSESVARVPPSRRG